MWPFKRREPSPERAFQEMIVASWEAQTGWSGPPAGGSAPLSSSSWTHADTGVHLTRHIGFHYEKNWALRTPAGAFERLPKRLSQRCETLLEERRTNAQIDLDKRHLVEKAEIARKMLESVA